MPATPEFESLALTRSFHLRSFDLRAAVAVAVDAAAGATVADCTFGGVSSRMMSSWNVSPAIALGRKRTYTVFGRRSGPDESNAHGIVVSGWNVWGPPNPPPLETRRDEGAGGKWAGFCPWGG